jgi:8-amino-7-oxononanoate synthase
VAREALRLCEAGDGLRAELWARVHHAEGVLAGRGVTPTGSQILALILHGDEPTMRAAAALQARGFDVRGIRPPTVPEGLSRLRIAITRNVSPDDIDALGAALEEIAA